RPGTGLDAPHPRHVRRGTRRGLRAAGTDGTRRRPRRDRAVLRVLRLQPPVVLLHRADPGARGRRDPPGLTEEPRAHSSTRRLHHHTETASRARAAIPRSSRQYTAYACWSTGRATFRTRTPPDVRPFSVPLCA